MKVVGYPETAEVEVGGIKFRRRILVELTRRNLIVLLAKLDMEGSARTIEKDGIAIRAVEDVEHYADSAPGPMLVNGEVI
jgi:hypothetical protein